MPTEATGTCLPCDFELKGAYASLPNEAVGYSVLHTATRKQEAAIRLQRVADGVPRAQQRKMVRRIVMMPSGDRRANMCQLGLRSSVMVPGGSTFLPSFAHCHRVGKGDRYVLR